MYFRFVSGIILKRYNSNFNCESIRNIYFCPQNCGKVHSKFKWCKHKITTWLQAQSIQIKTACTKQFEFIAEQKFRRSLEIFRLYTKIWDEVALKEFLRLFRYRITNNTKNFLMGAVGVTMYNWEQERITDKEIYNYVEEIEDLRRLRDLTVVCHECHLRIVIDANQPEVKYCQCYKVKNSSNMAQKEGMEWEPFTECKDMLVWRKEEQNSRGLYSYKVYGSFNDISAEDFLQVQIDLDYRTKWDATVKELKIIDTDPLSKESMENCNDIIYWETIWPRMFANRDYVYQRKWLYNKETGIIIIVNKGTNHPNAPERSDTYRVTTYWSYMVIKPYTNPHEPGVEFGLTYFDNPGMNVPGFTTWIMMSGLTKYLCQLREAVKNYKNYKATQISGNTIPTFSTTNSSNIDILDTKNKQDNNEKHQKIIDDNNNNNNNSNNNNYNNNNEISNLKEVKGKPELIINEFKDKNTNINENENENENETEEENSESDSTENNQKLLDHFFLTKLFV